MFKTILFLLLILCMGFSSCQKLVDYYHSHAGGKSPACRVMTVTDQHPDGTIYYTATVAYNSDGLPESVTDRFISEFDVMEDIDPYIYDEQNRLIKEGPFSTPRPSYRHYVYEGNSRLPVRDTLYSIAHVYVEEFEYDQLGRIIRELRRTVYEPGGGEPTEPVDLRKYYYDLRGNRQEDPSNPGYPGIIKYSDKPSLYSLSRVWQIQYRDFSKNATMNGETFNNKGLPLTIKRNYSGYFQPFLRMDPGATITYACD